MSSNNGRWVDAIDLTTAANDVEECALKTVRIFVSGFSRATSCPCVRMHAAAKIGVRLTESAMSDCERMLAESSDHKSLTIGDTLDVRLRDSPFRFMETELPPLDAILSSSDRSLSMMFPSVASYVNESAKRTDIDLTTSLPTNVFCSVESSLSIQQVERLVRLLCQNANVRCVIAPVLEYADVYEFQCVLADSMKTPAVEGMNIKDVFVMVGAVSGHWYVLLAKRASYKAKVSPFEVTWFNPQGWLRGSDRLRDLLHSMDNSHVILNKPMLTDNSQSATWVLWFIRRMVANEFARISKSTFFFSQYKEPSFAPVRVAHAATAEEIERNQYAAFEFRRQFNAM